MSLGYNKQYSTLLYLTFTQSHFVLHSVPAVIDFLFVIHWTQGSRLWIIWWKRRRVWLSLVCGRTSAEGGICHCAAAEAFLTGQFSWLWQHWRHQNALLLKQNARSTVGDPDFWNATLWLTWNHKSNDRFPSHYNFPPSSICFSFEETKRFTLFPLWKHSIPEGIAGSINHWHGCIVITSTHCIRPALWKENTGHQTYDTRRRRSASCVWKLKTLSVTG